MAHATYQVRYLHLGAPGLMATQEFVDKDEAIAFLEGVARDGRYGTLSEVTEQESRVVRMSVFANGVVLTQECR